MITSQVDLRKAFWLTFTCSERPPKEYRGKSQNELPADLRQAWCDFVDYSQKNGVISENLAQKATL